MSNPSPPNGYDRSYSISVTPPRCLITVGFDRNQSHIPRFLVKLHYCTHFDPEQWQEIARMDHNETAPLGHDVYQQGLHVDVRRKSTGQTVKLHPAHGGLPSSRGTVIDGCRKYLESNARYFIDVYEGNISSGSPPTWPDGGDSSSEPPMLITSEAVDAHMSQEPSSEDPISPGELREILAEVEGTTPEAIEQGAEEIEIAPPNEADVIEQ